MLRVGWNGVKAADTTDPEKNPLGEDVNKGWHQLAREWNEGSQIIKAEAGKKIHFDPDGKGDYRTLDEMASDLINTTIDPLFRQDPRLVVLVGTDLVARRRPSSTAKPPSRASRSPPRSWLSLSPGVAPTSRRSSQVNGW